MTDLTRQQRRAEERRAKKQGSTPVATQTPDVDVFTLPMLNDHNIAVFRDQHGVNTPEDMQRVVETRALLAAAHDALIDLPFDTDDYGSALSEMGDVIDILDAVITPTEEGLSNYFVDEWAFYVVDGECHVRYDSSYLDQMAAEQAAQTNEEEEADTAYRAYRHDLEEETYA
mgnify:CR=1 FL=1